LQCDVRDGVEFDLLRGAAQQLILGWISSGCIAGVWAAPPCKSWTIARRGPCGSSWAPVRSSECLEGLPNLHATDLAKVLEGNATAKFLSSVVAASLHAGISIAIENPLASYLWSWGPLQTYLGAESFVSHVVDFCQFGARWRKRTRIWTWNTPYLRMPSLCTGRGGRCSLTGKYHVALGGRDRASGRLWSAIAETYPSAFCRLIAHELLRTFEDRKFHKRCIMCFRGAG
jgi:hypothetical protein